jgi:hypothetical protein
MLVRGEDLDRLSRVLWFYVTAFVSPATGETFWYLSNGVSKGRPMPPRIIEHEQDDAAHTCFGFARKGLEQSREKFEQAGDDELHRLWEQR